MRLTNLFVFLFLLFFLVLSAPAQTVKNKDIDQIAADAYQKVTLRNNAIDLAREVGKRSSELPIREKLELRLKTSEVLWKYDEAVARQLLEAAWQDTFSDDIKNASYADQRRKEIYDFALKVAPERAKNWLPDLTGKRSDDENLLDKSKTFTDRQTSDLILRTSIANLAANPQGAVLAAISSLYQTRKISREFESLVQRLDAVNRADLISTVYKGVTDFTKERNSIDEGDISAVLGLIMKPFATTDDRNILFEFLVNSGRQIVITQNSNQDISKLSNDQILSIYMRYALSFRPFVEHEMNARIGVVDQLIEELAAVTPPEHLADPLLNPKPIEKQIEDARKTAGSTERDIKLTKIATWLLNIGRRKSGKADYLRLAQSLADEITDIPTRENIRDFVKLVVIERFVVDKNYSDAEKTVLTITSLEIKSWALMALGESQEMYVAASLELYDSAQAVLRKSKPTPNKAQLSLILASLLAKNDEVRSLEVLADAAKYSSQAEEVGENTVGRDLYISSYIAKRNFTSTDLETKINEVYIPSELGKLASGHWEMATDISKQMQPLRLQLELQLILAKSALDYVETSNKQSHDRNKTP